ncbi:Uncharacterised protein [Mycobacteroides abscessus]|nr:Uncharacterised protein [Mycobacteroides abscessus]
MSFGRYAAASEGSPSVSSASAFALSLLAALMSPAADGAALRAARFASRTSGLGEAGLLVSERRGDRRSVHTSPSMRLRELQPVPPRRW